MKRISLLLSFAITIVFCLSACGETPASDTTAPEKEETVQSESAEESKTAQSVGETPPNAEHSYPDGAESGGMRGGPGGRGGGMGGASTDLERES